MCSEQPSCVAMHLHTFVLPIGIEKNSFSNDQQETAEWILAIIPKYKNNKQSYYNYGSSTMKYT